MKLLKYYEAYGTGTQYLLNKCVLSTAQRNVNAVEEIFEAFFLPEIVKKLTLCSQTLLFHNHLKVVALPFL